MTNDVVKKLNEAKKQKGLTLAQLSEQTGITLGTINKIMSGSLQKIKTDKLEKLAQVLDVSTSYLTQENATANDTYLGLISTACITPNVQVGNCQYNSQQIVDLAKKAYDNGVQLALFPELAITGYTCGDLFFQQSLLNNALQGLQYVLDNLAYTKMIVIVGMPIVADNGKLYNAGVVTFNGQILGVVPKINLPNYNEFNEKRYFTPFVGETTTVTLLGKQVPFGSKIMFVDDSAKEFRLAVEICEDIWVPNSPSISHAINGANVICNLSSSNDTIVKQFYRTDMVKMQSAKLNCIYVYCSSGSSESTSDTVFGGHNIICENGVCLAESKPFTTDYCQTEVDVNFIENERVHMDHHVATANYTTVHFDMPLLGNKRVYESTPFVPSDKQELALRCQSALNILAHGLSKRISHTKAQKLVIGVSGGSDSTLALLTCANALKLLNRPNSDILAVTMPCFGTTKRTFDNSVALAKCLGATVKVVDISKSVTQHLSDIGHDLSVTNSTYENAQARERTQVLMDLANETNGLVIGTGDMSESALGWCTYNGDQMSMYNVNAGVSKTFVKALIKYVANNSNGDVKAILQDILDTPVSPELLPSNPDGTISQITENTVGPYVLHDYFLFMLLRKGFTPSKVYRLAQLSFDGQYDKEQIYTWLKKFITRFFSQQFKRSCSADGVKLGSVDLSKHGFLMPSDACCETWLNDLEQAHNN